MATRLQMRDRARAKADQDGSTFPTDTQYNNWLDEGASAVWRRLVGAGWRPDRTLISITATGAASYTLATDVHTILDVTRVISGGRIPMRRVKPEEIQPLALLTGPGLYYELTGGALAAQAIEFYPKPTGGTYEVRYIKRFPGFTADGDNWYGPDGSDQLIVLLAAISGANKEDAREKVASLKDEFQMTWTEVLEQANWLDQQSVPTVRDSRPTYPRDDSDYFVTNAWEWGY